MTLKGGNRMIHTKKIYVAIFLIAMFLFSYTNLKCSQRALGIRTITHSDNLRFIDIYGDERSVNYTLVFNLYSDTNGKYTNHKLQNITFENNQYATFHFKSLDLISLNSTKTLANLKLNIYCELKGSFASDYILTDYFSYSTYGPYY